MTIVDAHHHLVDPAAREYDWMAGEYAALLRRWDVEDLRSAANEVGVTQTVLVQTVADAAETAEFLRTASGSNGLIAGVVGWTDLTDDGCGTALDEVLAGAYGDRLVGIRHLTHNEPEASWLARPDVMRGLRTLGERNLVFDLLVRTRELSAALIAVEAAPELSFVIDHGAKPAIAGGGGMEAWRKGLRALAERPNVSCKVSGLVTEADWATWSPAVLQPYVDTLLEVFGADRLMWGSDWPVCTVAASYGDVLAAARTCLAQLSVDETEAVFGGNARRVYRLPAAG